MVLNKVLSVSSIIILSLSMCFPAFAASSLTEIDENGYNSAKQTIESCVVGEELQKSEMEILDKLYTELKENEDIKDRNAANKLINRISDESNIKPEQWRAAFEEYANTYNVPENAIESFEDRKDSALLDTAVSKLHILQWDEDDSGVNNSVMKNMINYLTNDGPVSSIMGISMSLAAALCIAFGLGDIIEKATEKSVSTESLWRAFLKMCIGLYIIFNCLYIAAAIIYVGDLLLTTALNANAAVANGEVSTSFVTHQALWDSVYAMEKSGGISTVASLAAAGGGSVIDSVKNIVSSAASGIYGVLATLGNNTLGLISDLAGSGIITFIISLTVYAVAIDIGVRYVFTPLAIADLFSERFRSTGIRWLKSLAASALQGVIIYVIVVVGTFLRTSLESGAALPGFAPVTGTIVNLTMIGMFAKSRGFAQEIIGTH